MEALARSARDNQSSKKVGFYDLIEYSPLHSDLKRELHVLRRYRNRWVHGNDPTNDEDMLKRPEYHETELEQMAFQAIKVMRQIIYQEQFL